MYLRVMREGYFSGNHSNYAAGAGISIYSGLQAEQALRGDTLMYLVPTYVKNSGIEGKGVFAAQDIPEGTITWKFVAGKDRTLSKDEFSLLDKHTQEELLRVAYLSPTTDRWVYPSPEDEAVYTNHSENNNQTMAIDESISEEPFFIANRDVVAGEELTVNYAEFDNRPKDLLEKWVGKSN